MIGGDSSKHSTLVIARERSDRGPGRDPFGDNLKDGKCGKIEIRGRLYYFNIHQFKATPNRRQDAHTTII
jgi:hypothetical protein